MSNQLNVDDNCFFLAFFIGIYIYIKSWHNFKEVSVTLYFSIALQMIYFQSPMIYLNIQPTCASNLQNYEHGILYEFSIKMFVSTAWKSTLLPLLRHVFFIIFGPS